MLEKLNNSHLDITGTRHRAAECMYSYLNSDCETHRSMEEANAKMPLTPREIPDGPLTKIDVNLFTLNNFNCLTLVYFSGYVEVDDLLDTLFCSICQKVPFCSIWTV